ncbi:hypothetical protein PGTUg99_001912 [Puccinia graminis f. sp. tritici]|uniref:Uncharacterized protein n=1 Tax=Puccinia graminis f. sp. tritici TaxID=56615 RepID=A0A5B0RR82_PUCGR|nr:hypothetical protein PGTUg99_001912 [Puccinia graminis f. sp. tritici]
MPRSSKQAKSIQNMRQILRLHITQAASETRYKESDEESSTSEDSEIKELVMTLISIKKSNTEWKEFDLNKPQTSPNISFCLDTGRFKQEFWMSQDSFYQLLDLIKDNLVSIITPTCPSDLSKINSW